MIDVFASLPHYADHLAPIWRALPPDVRGEWIAGSPDAYRYAAAEGLQPARWERALRPDPATARRPVLVAGWTDLQHTHPRPAVFVEHGAGQRYEHPDPHYAGGPQRDRVALFLCPNEAVAEANRRAYPTAAVEVVGSPRLDVLARARAQTPRPDEPTVAISFHWPCRLSPECGTAWPEWRTTVEQLVADHDRVRWVGHGHPRAWATYGAWWAKLGVEAVQSWEAVVSGADAYVCDNSSTLYEAAALGVPVVLLASARWRRHVDLGLRFWSALPGPQLDEPDAGALWAAIEGALVDDEWEAERRRVAAEVYARPPGGATAAAARAVLHHLT